ncbi:structural maintenance of chromosomes protein 1A-like [Ctenocephalides felis]|uniref:structural maintenance of chromosomes protein 1A-like n=2 Tax=Ctenocephalides felis TaxID=7515 RepID=UPI000E6E5BE3|nr:structural maintenance of chromosomes protein 1A-like [Ctenocephalides felis]
MSQIMETDRVVLSHLEIQNFKSYKDLVKIVLDEKYSALVGSNGTGKSNFLDAICFVMGQNVTQLRGNNLKDLIYGAIWNEEIPSGAYVKAYLKINGREESFKRTIDVHKCIYQISDKVVTYAKYVDNLEKIGIFAKVENFIVHQGEVEHIANMHKNDLTSKLDVLCGSYKLKDDYERLTNEKIRLEGKIASIHKDQNKILREIRNCKALKKEAGKLTVLQKEIEYRQTTLKVYELYVLKESIAKLECKLTEHLVHVDTIESKKQTIFESTDTLRRELKQLNRELWEIEQRNLKTYADIAKQRDPYVQAQEEIIGLRKQLDSAEKNLAKAVEEKNAYEHSIQNVERNYNLFLSEITDSELSTSTIISLEESQLRDYYNIKNESDKKTALLTCEQINIDRAIKQREDNLNRLMMEKQTLQNQKVALEAKIVKMDSEKYERQIQSMNLELTEIQQRSDQIGRLQERQNILLNEIEENKCRLQEARCSKEDYFEEKRRQSVLTRLKELHEGVYGRFLDLCQPIHARYNIAATKVVRKYLFAIVVDTESTAKSCISTLKMEKLGIETFLPLDSISTKRIIENLRNREEENIRLLIDVLQYENTIYRAVNHVIGNTLVCKTPDDADKASLDYNQNHGDMDLGCGSTPSEGSGALSETVEA